MPARLSSFCDSISTGNPRPHQRHRAVPHLGGAERFGVQAAGLLELERRFLRDAEAEAAPDDEQARARFKAGTALLQSSAQACSS